MKRKDYAVKRGYREAHSRFCCEILGSVVEVELGICVCTTLA